MTGAVLLQKSLPLGPSRGPETEAMTIIHADGPRAAIRSARA